MNIPTEVLYVKIFEVWERLSLQLGWHHQWFIKKLPPFTVHYHSYEVTISKRNVSPNTIIKRGELRTGLLVKTQISSPSSQITVEWFVQYPQKTPGSGVHASVFKCNFQDHSIEWMIMEPVTRKFHFNHSQHSKSPLNLSKLKFLPRPSQWATHYYCGITNYWMPVALKLSYIKITLELYFTSFIVNCCRYSNSLQQFIYSVPL